jgi:hypothetical protein
MKGQDWENLVEFVREYAKDKKLADEALGLVSVILPTKRQQLKNLCWADPDLAEPTWAALTAATNLSIERLRFVSLRETLREHDVRGHLNAASLEAALNSLDNQVDDTTLGFAIGQHLNEDPDITTRLGQPAADYFIEAVHDAFGQSHQAVDSVVYYYLGMAVTGQSSKAYRLKNLVALLTRLLPLGQLRGKTGCWLVLVN